jgi:hypothetical protein
MAVWASVGVGVLSAPFRLDAEHYRPEYLRAAESTAHGESFRDVVAEIIHPVELTREYEDSGLPLLMAQNIRPDGLRVHAPWFMSEDLRTTLSRSAIRPGDVVMTRSGVNYGDTGAFMAMPLGRGEYYASADCLIIRPKTIPPGYLSSFLSCSVGRALVDRGGYGGGQPHIAPSYLWTLRVPRGGGAERSTDNLVRRSWDAGEESHRLIASAEARLMKALGLDRLDLSSKKAYTRRFKDLQGEARFDAEYFNPKYQKVIGHLRKADLTLADVAPSVHRMFRPTTRKRGSTFDYIEIGSLDGDGEANAETLDVADAPSRAKWIVRPGDIITSVVRPIRRLSAMIRPEQDGHVCSSGFAVLTTKAGEAGIEPEVLLTYLRLPIICELLDLNCTASMYPAIPEDRLIRIPFIVPDSKTRGFVVEQVQAAFTARREAARFLEQAKKTVEDLIAGGIGRTRR